MSRTGWRVLWGVIVAGTAARLVLAFVTDGQAYDIQSFALVRDALDDDPLHVYGAVNPAGGGARMPYPAGVLPLVALLGLVSDATGLAFSSLIRTPAIAADAAIAFVVQGFLGRRGASERVRLAAAGLVALGPSFMAIAGYHGHFDSVAILPAVVAVALWDRVREDRRALYAGLLIGLGAAMKTTPIVLVLALLPAVRSRREAVTLVAAAVAVPVLATLPFLLADPDAVVRGLRYRGFPGTSGLSILIQPGLGEQVTHGADPNGAVDFLYDRGPLLVGAALLGTAAFAWRAQPVERAALLWFAFYAVTPVFFFQYLVWGLPFVLMAGRLRLAAAIQAVAVLPTLLFYRAPWDQDAAAPAYTVTMLALWLLLVAALVHLGRDVRHAAPAAA